MESIKNCLIIESSVKSLSDSRGKLEEFTLRTTIQFAQPQKKTSNLHRSIAHWTEAENRDAWQQQK